MFNEREAIMFEMQELKEQSRRDFEMYFEMRKYRNERYNALQNRLREIDDRDMKSEVKEHSQECLVKLFDNLPAPKSIDLTVDEIRLDRYNTPRLPLNPEKPADEERKSMAKIPYEQLAKDIEEFLKLNGPCKLGAIKRMIQSKYDIKYKNYNTVVKHAMQHSESIKADRSGRKNFIYSYRRRVQND